MKSNYRYLCAILGGILLLSTAIVVAADTGGTDQEPAQSTIEHKENTTNYLTPTDSDTIQNEQIELRGDASSTTNLAVHTIHNSYNKRSMVTQFAQNSPTEVESGKEIMQSIEDHYQSLNDYQQNLIKRYRVGAISGQRLIEQFILIQKRAEALSDAKNTINERIDTPTNLQESVDSLEEAILVEQPVVDIASDRINEGGKSSTKIYSSVGTNSIILVSINKQDYIRQATLFDERDLKSSDSFRNDEFWGAGNAYDYLTNSSNRLYQWAFAEENFNEISVGRNGASIYSQVYKFDIVHKQGTLTVYLDGGTTNVFHENQVIPIDKIPITDTRVNNTGDFKIIAERTIMSGPMNISLTDNSGDPIENASVEVEGPQMSGTYANRTDENGSALVVQPYGDFSVTATTQQGNKSSVSFP